MRFRILGPLEVDTGAAWTSIGAAKWRSLLAYLLLSGGQPVSTDSLIHAVWGDNPPARATNLVSIYVLRLRRLIGDTEGKVLRTRAPGYQLQLGRDDLDSQHFGLLMSQGRQALTAGHPDRAAALLADALALWRGTALADVPPSDFIEAEADRLNELRLAALELRIEADIACGRHRQVIPDLKRLLADQPLKEELWLLLMRALDGAGRRAEALTVYEQARTVIADQLGVDPGPEMRKLFQQLLSADEAAAPAAKPAVKKTGRSPVGGRPAAPPGERDADLEPPATEPGEGRPQPGAPRAAETPPGGLPAQDPAMTGAPGVISLGTIEARETTAAGSVGARAGPPPAEPGPMQLPADIADFTGREVHVDELCRLLSVGRSDDNPGAVPVALVAGAGGLGKTTLAIHAAHRMRAQYPDGVLYVDLLGANPQPLAPADVLARFLRDLGVREPQIPVREEERGALCRTRLNGRRTLIVLDNARDAAQVRPLLPGSASCAVIVTSRSRLPNLVGGGLVHLDVLDDSEALALFSRVVGTSRTEAEPDATAELLVACAGLPLAIRICAARLAARTRWTIRSLADRIGDEHRRLDELKVGDLAVRASFEVSFGALPSAAPGNVPPAHAFRMLGLWQGPSIGLPGAAALIGQPEDRVAGALEDLVDAHLLESPSLDRYQFHDLLRVYAAERANADEPADVRRSGVGRLLSWYVHTADAAGQVVSPYRYKTDLDTPEPGCQPLSFTSADQALSWYDEERASVIAATRQAAGLGFDGPAWQLAASLFSVFSRRGNWADCVTTHRVALDCVRRTGNRRGQAWILNNLGEALGQRQVGEAISYLEDALAIRREIGDRRGEAQAANNLANVYLELGRPQEALEPLQRSLVVQREVGYRNGEGIALINLAEAYLELGRFDEAIQSLGQARPIFVDLDAPRGEGYALHHLGRAHLEMGRTGEALGCLQRALSIRRGMGDRQNEAATLRLLGQAQQSAGDLEAAHDCWTRALNIVRELGDERQAAEIAAALEHS